MAPVNYTSLTLLDRQATDSFLQDLTFDLAELTFVVINHLSIDDQIIINKLHKDLVQKHRGRRRSEAEVKQLIKREIILVHNYRHLETQEDVNVAIEHDLVRFFAAQKRVVSGDNGKIFFESADFTHYILAKDGTEAGKFWYPMTAALLKRLFGGVGRQTHSADVFDSVWKKSAALLTNYVELVDDAPPSATDNDSNEGVISYVWDTIKTWVSPGSKPVTRSSASLDAELIVIENGSASQGAVVAYGLAPKAFSRAGTLQFSRFLQFRDGGSYFNYNAMFEPEVFITRRPDAIRIYFAASQLVSAACTIDTDSNILTIAGKHSPVATQQGYQTLLSTVKQGDFDFSVKLPAALYEEQRTQLSNACSRLGPTNWNLDELLSISTGPEEL